MVPAHLLQVEQYSWHHSQGQVEHKQLLEGIPEGSCLVRQAGRGVRVQHVAADNGGAGATGQRGNFAVGCPQEGSEGGGVYWQAPDITSHLLPNENEG